MTGTQETTTEQWRQFWLKKTQSQKNTKNKKRRRQNKQKQQKTTRNQKIYVLLHITN